MSTWTLILQGFLPLLVFVIVDMFSGLKWGVASAIVLALAECVWDYASFGEIDPVTLVSTFLVIGMGALALHLDNSKYFKFQPVVLGVLCAGLIGWFQFFDEPLMLKMLPKMLKMLPPEAHGRFEDPVMKAHLAALSGQLGWLFIAHGAAVAFAAWRMSNLAWLLMRGVGFWLFVAILYAYDWLRWTH